MAEREKSGFDPARYLIKIKGNDYLPVAARVAWFRSLFPNGTIDTEILHLDMQARSAIVKATVVAINGEGQVLGRATGIKEGTPNGKITDFVELGETGSIGRALASLGIGTLQAGDELGETDYIVDSPVEPPANRHQQPPANAAIVKQQQMIVGLAKQLGMVKPDGHHDGPRLDESLRKRVGATLSGLTMQQASDAIEKMQAAINATKTPPAAEEMDAAIENATPTSLPLDTPDTDRFRQ